MEAELLIYPLLLAAISLLIGYMLANILAYAKYRLGSNTQSAPFFNRIGIILTLGISLFCCFSIELSLQNFQIDSLNLTQIGIIATSILLVSSASLLGFILTFRLIS